MKYSERKSSIEDRLRRTATRRGYTFSKVRRVDKLAVDYGQYHVYEAESNTRVSPEKGFSLRVAGVLWR